MKIIYCKLAITLFCVLSTSVAYGDDSINQNNLSWFGVFRNFSNAKYDERGQFVGSEKHLAQKFSCEYQTRKDLKQYLDDNPDERGQGQFGGYYVNWQAVIPTEGENSIGHQSLSYLALTKLIENPSKSSHNPCWITNDSFYLSRDSEEELSNEALVCQTVKDGILIRISKTTEENLFRRVYLNKENGRVFPSTKQWLKKCQN